MNEYKVTVTEHALHSMMEVRDYISMQLSNPESAENHLRLFRNKMKQLSTMPGKYRTVDEQPWHDKGIRKVMVKNYYIYYWISEKQHTVYVTDVIYAGSDQSKWLEQMPVK